MRGEEGWYELLLEMLPEGWEAKAKELGAMKRARVVKTPGELLRLILLYFKGARWCQSLLLTYQLRRCQTPGF